MTVRKPIPESVQRAIVQAVPENRRVSEASRLQQASRILAVRESPAAKDEKFARLPQLMFFSPKKERKLSPMPIRCMWRRSGIMSAIRL